MIWIGFWLEFKGVLFVWFDGIKVILILFDEVLSFKILFWILFGMIVELLVILFVFIFWEKLELGFMIVYLEFE